MKKLRQRVTAMFIMASIVVSTIITSSAVVFAVPVVETLLSSYPDAVPSTPPENTFRVAGSDRTFIILDTTNNDAGKFFILASDCYGMYPFDMKNGDGSDPTKGTNKFDPSDAYNVAAMMNSDTFRTNGNTARGGTGAGKVIPAAIWNYMENHTWFTGAGPAGTKAYPDFNVTCKASLLSLTEFNQYYKKLGYLLDSSAGNYNGGWWLRTPYWAAWNDNPIYEIKFENNEMVVGPGGSVNFWNKGVRPCFYLNRDFFKNVKLDISTLGSKVKEILIDNYSVNDFAKGTAGYTQSEIEQLGFVNPPQAKDVSILGGMAVSEVLSGNYTYFAPDGQNEKDSVYKWVYSDSRNGTYFTIPGMDTKLFTADSSYIGKYVKFEVTPKKAGGVITEGYISQSQIIGPLRNTQEISAFFNGFTVNNGSAFSGLSANPSSIKANMQITNRTNSTKALKMIIALYDINNTMQKSENTQISAAVGTQSYSISMDLGQYETGQYVKTILIENSAGIRPLSTVGIAR